MNSERQRPADPGGYYDAHVFCCTNRRQAGHPRGCCAEKGGEELRDYFKAAAKARGLKNVRVNSAGCLDRCEEGPVIVVYPEEVWYTYVDRADVDEIIDEHLQHGRVVERLHEFPRRSLGRFETTPRR